MDDGRTARAVTDRVIRGPIKLQELFIPIHGLVRLHENEVDIVNHPAFQHLGFIYQLGQTSLVYRGATHTRLEHSLGTRAVAEQMIQALDRNCSVGAPSPKDRVGNWALDVRLTEVERRFVRLGALLHDIGHLPAGHTLEDELGRLDAHDKRRRLRLIWNRTKWNGRQTESLRVVIDRQFAGFAKSAAIPHRSASRFLTATEIVELLIAKDYVRLKRTGSIRVEVCRDIIGNTICADLLDYLHRDWHHIGKARTYDPRILEYLEIRTKQTTGGHDARLVINLRSGHRIRTDAVTGILDLLESRYQLAEIALFHRTKVCAAAMLERALAELTAIYSTSERAQQAFLRRLERLLLDVSDTEMYSLLEDLARRGARGRSGSAVKSARAVSMLMRALRDRSLHKHLSSTYEYQLPQTAKITQDLYSGPSDEPDARRRAAIGAKYRLDAVRLLERDFNLPTGSLVMYCPPRKMNSKIADVQILIHQDVYTLAKFEEGEPDRGITGGHLAAQQERFRRLWRLQFAIDPAIRERLKSDGLFELLGRAIDLLVLGDDPTVGTIQDDVLVLARELTRMPGTKLGTRKVLSGNEVSDLIAARGKELNFYPGGLLSLLDSTVPKTGGD